jgi:hypothetical protein
MREFSSSGSTVAIGASEHEGDEAGRYADGLAREFHGLYEDLRPDHYQG